MPCLILYKPQTSDVWAACSDSDLDLLHRILSFRVGSKENMVLCALGFIAMPQLLIKKLWSYVWSGLTAGSSALFSSSLDQLC